MVTQFTDDACGADDRSILTYSQSSNPDSLFFADQTRMFSNKEWVNPPFCEAAVLAEPGLQIETLTGCLPGGCGSGPGGGGPGGDGQPSGTAGAIQAACSNPISGTRRNDRLRGTDGPDRLRGRHGDDRLRGGGGEDCLHGGSGDDVLSSQDGGPDLVRCGRGTDRVKKSDRGDVLRGCEQRG